VYFDIYTISSTLAGRANSEKTSYLHILLTFVDWLFMIY